VASVAKDGIAQRIKERDGGIDHLIVALGAEMADGQGLHGGRILSGLVDFIGEQGLEPAKAVLLHAQGLVVRLAEGVAFRHLAEEMRAEQRVERRAALRRRRQRRMRGAANVRDRLRSKQANGGKEGNGLFGRDRKPVRPQERGKCHERLCRTR
jgi:hypothetical protein